MKKHVEAQIHRTLYTKKELMLRWGVTKRTVERDVRKFGLNPVAFVGIQPLWDLPSILAMEERRTDARSRQLGYRKVLKKV